MYIKPMNIKKQRIKKGTALSSLVPYAIFCEEGIVLEKNGALTCGFEFVAPDIESSSANTIASVGAMFNDCLLRLGDGWAVQFELQRTKTAKYPAVATDELALYFFEKQRELNFSVQRNYYVNKYFMTLTYELPSEIQQKSKSFFFQKSEIYDNINLAEVQKQIRYFQTETSKFVHVLGNYIKIKRLNSEEFYTYLHTSVSLNWHKLILDESQKLFLSEYITDTDLETSMPMKLGKYYIPVVSINSFPTSTIPAMCDLFNRVDCELRWSTRFICYSRDLALAQIDKVEKKYHASRKSVGQYVMETVANTTSTREDSGALAQETDASQARADLTVGGKCFGNYTSTIMVWDKNFKIASDKAKLVASAANQCGFTAKEETFNALQAFLSMMPGNIWANVRTLFVSTTTTSHVMPLSSIWSGEKENKFLKKITGEGTPHIVCATEAGIPFFLNLNVQDVGHHWVSGPTGAGKSTYLAALELEWKKYPNSKVIIFDKDLSARNLTICVGGHYIEPGKDDVAYQPLRELETDEQMRWAAEFIECLMAEQKVEVTATIRKAIFQTIKILSTKDVEQRTLTSFTQYCEYINPTTGQNDINDALSPYTIDGQYGNLFDRIATDLKLGTWNLFEMGSLMNMNQGAVAPSLMYLFRECEKMFDGSPTMLVLDEAWVFLQNETFAKKIVEWLKVLRKKNVFVVFATQEIADAMGSPVASTIISQCGSKVYLADDKATTPLMKEAYKQFGLEPSEIKLLSRCRKKLDYFYKSALGTRLFQLDLDPLQLALITNSESDKKLLDKVEEIHGKNTGKKLVKEVLNIKGIDYSYLLKA